MKKALAKNHAGNVNPGAMRRGSALESNIVREQHDSQRDVANMQPTASANTGADGTQQITGYKMTPTQAEIARPISETQQDNALHSVIEAKQGLQTFGNFTTGDPFDEMVELMKSVGMDQDGIIPGVGKILVKEDHPFWEYGARKNAQEFHDDFKKFIYSQIDLTTPERRAYWEGRFPEYTQSLRAGLRKNRALRARMEDIGLYGVQNETDMWLLYMKEKGVAENEKFMEQELGGGSPYQSQNPLGTNSADMSAYNPSEGTNGRPLSRTPPVIGDWTRGLRNLFANLPGFITTNNNAPLGPPQNVVGPFL